MPRRTDTWRRLAVCHAAPYDSIFEGKDERTGLFWLIAAMRRMRVGTKVRACNLPGPSGGSGSPLAEAHRKGQGSSHFGQMDPHQRHILIEVHTLQCLFACLFVKGKAGKAVYFEVYSKSIKAGFHFLDYPRVKPRCGSFPPKQTKTLGLSLSWVKKWTPAQEKHVLPVFVSGSLFHGVGQGHAHQAPRVLSAKSVRPQRHGEKGAAVAHSAPVKAWGERHEFCGAIHENGWPSINNFNLQQVQVKKRRLEIRVGRSAAAPQEVDTPAQSEADSTRGACFA